MMPVQRKVFRIEQMLSMPVPAPAATRGADLPQSMSQPNIAGELKALRGLVERLATDGRKIDAAEIAASGLRQLRDETDTIHRAINRTKQEIATLHAAAFSGNGEARAARELDAVVEDTERATQQILDAAETIDEAANTLSASVRQEQERALAQDIREQALHIFEACNFQDLSGQRIAKVLATLTFVEDRVTRMMEIWGGSDALKPFAEHRASADHDRAKAFVNGPKLDGDHDHSTQAEVDALFAAD
jgi:chemotaxis protein CheZ